ncbi:hypothetical protein WL05_03605 [Burkholderia ubonensis]|uniref:hypothetical protein n=1 Tax=Burkholderia ubonensis TaxID=101571 RepID=UPI00075A5EB0|nr:hypothetical protein [Burkholderia ubonensis]KVM11673.1 hypothetical protein WJ51_16845 [Burkholderia ubonensis]KVM13779.1 hypothetical protein WJ52_17815 [Burkholderia ubonensis]KVM41999.1 hypothetical protein WJ56_01690 [Burkholderia ubonensis]KVO00423.1 hypothetical protein WJ69_31130 [Burkholderia ubonensis]KVO00485.1 hypothetical protein WJ71_23335 [Burkholderia ubonensis]
MKRNTFFVPGIVNAVAAPLATPDVGQDHGPVLDLGDPRDRRVIADALRALLRERSEALAFAMRMADERDRPRPDANDFALTDIIRLARVVERAERYGDAVSEVVPVGAR